MKIAKKLLGLVVYSGAMFVGFVFIFINMINAEYGLAISCLTIALVGGCGAVCLASVIGKNIEDAVKAQKEELEKAIEGANYRASIYNQDIGALKGRCDVLEMWSGRYIESINQIKGTIDKQQRGTTG